MSLGKLLTDGEKGSNFNWQMRMLQMLELIRTAVVSSGGGSASTEVITSGNVSISGTIAVGFRKVTFETSEDFTGSINGMTRQPSRAYTFEPHVNDNTLPAIPYVITSGNINIDKQV